MSRTITIASKFSEDEVKVIDWYAENKNTTRSSLMHDLVMSVVKGEEAIELPQNIHEVTFRFTDNFAYFWKDREYKGIINGDEASVFFGGDWMHYKLDELPIEVIEK